MGGEYLQIQYIALSMGSQILSMPCKEKVRRDAPADFDMPKYGQRNLLFPVVPDVLDVVVVLHGVDELLHPKPSVSWVKPQ